MYQDRVFETNDEYLGFLSRSRSFNMDGGNIYRVLHKSKAFYADFLKQNQFKYSDGSDAFYSDSGTGDGIRAAIAACKGGRSDYIIVGTGSYQLDTVLDLTGKSSVHLIGVNGLNRACGSDGAALLQQTGSDYVVKLEAYNELAGFQIINKTGYAAVYVAANKWRPNIHNNCFHTVAGSAINIVDASAAAACSYGSISYNRFATWVGGNMTSCINVGTGTGVDIIGNMITHYNGTLDYGITQAGAQCFVYGNKVSDCGGGGVVTVAVNVYQYSSAISNRLSVPAGYGLSGGTSAKSFVDNMDGATGAGNGAASNLET